MTDEPHMDETRPDQTIPADSPADAKPEPSGFADLPLQPTGSGVADEQMAFEQAEREMTAEDGSSTGEIRDSGF